MYKRHLEGPLREALADTPVVLLMGARQVGKSTLAQTLVPADRYLTLDDATVLAAAEADPAAFVEQFDALTVIDEVQRAPKLLLEIKASVDRRRRPGRFLLTGSANVLTGPKVAESLAGRMEILYMWPLSQGEIARRPEGFIDALRRERLPAAPAPIERHELIDRALRGGYPDALNRSEPRRLSWLRSYITSVLARDVRDLANIDSLTALPRLLALLASRAAGLLNLADISRTAGIPYTSLQRHLALLEKTFLVHQIDAWATNLGARVLKSAKLLLVDSGLAAALLDLRRSQLANHPMFGHLVENFVLMELRKQCSWHAEQPTLYHFRTPKGAEVDAVLEIQDQVFGIEIKGTGTVTGDDFRGLRILADIAGKRFRRGVVLHLGQRVVPFGAHLHAVPLSALWEW